ncbi:MAG: magnesium transporter MgtC [Gemmatimonadales bacterium]|nr:MAG: magnesium transporter MgtC [Gemmatimonadales bacterium]
MPQWADHLIEALELDLLGYFLLAVLLGGAIGLERELRGKAAGLRTNILICLGAALFTRLSVTLAGPSGDPARIAAQIVTGVGFLGAGTILHSRGSITGLTSAATIWLVAAIGTAVGAGAILEASGTTLLVLLVLRLLGSLEEYLQRQAVVARLHVETDPDPRMVEEVERVLRQSGLEVQEIRTGARGDRMVVHVSVRGPRRLHDDARLSLLRTSGAYTLSVEEE